MLTGLDPEQIQDLAGARQAIVLLLNLVEELKQENDQLRVTVQQLRDEINRLKGEQGKPEIKPNKQKSSAHSSEKERRKPRRRQKSSKLGQVKVDRDKIVRVDKSELAADAEFKGYEAVVVQELKVETDNTRFLKEKYYSPDCTTPKCERHRKGRPQLLLHCRFAGQNRREPRYLPAALV